MIGLFYVIYNYLFHNSKNFYYLSLINSNGSWHIHGLWPQYSTNSYPTFCKQVNFDVNKLTPIISDLNLYWYSDEEKNNDFW